MVNRWEQEGVDLKDIEVHRQLCMQVTLSFTGSRSHGPELALEPVTRGGW